MIQDEKKISLLEDELASYKYQDKYYSYLEDYINSDNNFENTIAPSTYGITNTSLSEMVKKLVNIQIRLRNKFLEKRNERINLIGEDKAKEIEKRIFLQVIDENWKMHIQYLEQLRQVIGLRSFGQRDPLVEYKKEAFNLFENLLNKLKSDLVTLLINMKVVDSSEDENNFKQKQNDNFGKLSSSVSIIISGLFFIAIKYPKFFLE